MAAIAVEFGAVDVSPGVLPRWEGRALVGRPAWKGQLTSARVDWQGLYLARRPIVVRVGERTSQAVITYWSSVDPETVLVEGGPEVPFS